MDGGWMEVWESLRQELEGRCRQVEPRWKFQVWGRSARARTVG
jgi:hypothetical protein